MILVMLGCAKGGIDLDTDVVLSANVELRLANVSAPGDLHASNGDHDVKLAPGVVIVHDGSFSLFTPGQKIRLPASNLCPRTATRPRSRPSSRPRRASRASNFSPRWTA